MILSVVRLDSAQATEGQGSNSLTLDVVYDQVPVTEMSFRLYYVAEIQQDGTIVPVEELQDAPISFDLETSEEVQACAETLDAYLISQQKERNCLQPVDAGQTDTAGRLTFDNLADGLYLLVGSQTEQDGTTYIPTTTLLSLPQAGSDQTLVRNVEIDPKMELRTSSPSPEPGEETPEPETTSVSVQIVWDYDGELPQEVTVVLYRNGEEYDRVVLSAENNWQYTWDGLEANVLWSVMELSVPDGYTVTVSPDGQSFVITNTKTTVPQESETPTTSTSPTTTTTTPTTTTTTTTQKIPQTGQLWWPVPLGGAVGLCLFLLGWGFWRRAKGGKR
jgi:hypothetical protein